MAWSDEMHAAATTHNAVLGLLIAMGAYPDEQPDPMLPPPTRRQQASEASTAVSRVAHAQRGADRYLARHQIDPST